MKLVILLSVFFVVVTMQLTAITDQFDTELHKFFRQILLTEHFRDSRATYVIIKTVQPINSYINAIQTPLLVTENDIDKSLDKSWNLTYFLPNDFNAAVLFTDEIDEVAATFKKHVKTHLITPRSKTVVILMQCLSLDNNFDHIKRCFMGLWKINVINVVLIFADCVLGVIRSFTYNPFIDDYFIELTNRPLTEYFKDKTNNLYGYPLRVSVYVSLPYAYTITEMSGDTQWIGIDAIIGESLAKHLNTTSIVTGPFDGMKRGLVFWVAFLPLKEF